MPDSTSRQQFQRLCLLPLNQLASLKLRQAGVVEETTSLPVFCLMEWGLALAYLLENLPGGLPQLHRKLLPLSPQGAAQTLLEVFDMRLRADPRNPYPSN